METSDPSLTLTCCGGKKCPVVTKHDGGKVTLRDTVAGQANTIVLSREQVDKLAIFLGWQPPAA